MTKCTKQKGGGVFDVFCPLCNLPFYSPFDEHNKPPSDDDEGDDLYDLRNTDLKWLSNVLGFDDNTNTVMELKCDDRYGQFPIKNGKNKGGLFGLRDSIVLIEGIKKKEEYDGIGAAFHNDCVKYISQKSGRQINYQLGVDIEQKIEDYFKANPKVRRDDNYQQQTYNFEGALEDNGPEYFVSPLEKDGNHVRGLLNDFIPTKATSPKAATPSPKAATPSLEKTNSPGSPGSPGSPSANGSCSSQKDKAVCIKKKCVWGKTNRCSKKRATMKKKSSKKNKPMSSSSSCPSHKNKEECINKNCIWGKTNRCSKKRVSKK
jgi:hypothetical protein